MTSLYRFFPEIKLHFSYTGVTIWLPEADFPQFLHYEQILNTSLCELTKSPSGGEGLMVFT